MAYVDISSNNLDKKLQFKPLINDWVAGFTYIHNDGEKFYFKTNYSANMFDITEAQKDYINQNPIPSLDRIKTEGDSSLTNINYNPY